VRAQPRRQRPEVVGGDDQASRKLVERERIVDVEAQQQPRFSGRDVEPADPREVLVDAMAVLAPGERAESSLQLVERCGVRGEAKLSPMP
jgi:hypothetical protein